MTGTLQGAGARVGALRRTPSAAQRDFTTLLDVLSRPGKVGRLQVPDGVPAAALAAAGLVDVEVALHVLDRADGAEGSEDADGSARGWGEAVHAATNAPRTELEFARTLLALRPVTSDEVARLARGDALNPERGTRLFAAVDALVPYPHDGDPETAGPGPDRPAPAGAGTLLRLTGPGVRDERLLTVHGLSDAVFTALAAANAAFPLGVDTFLVARDGSVAGLPRTTRITVGGA